MSLSINSYNNLSTDRQKARATEFVNRNDREITKMATRAYNIAHRDEDKKFVKHLRTGVLALPAVALASGLMLKKGIKPSLKNSASWGIAIGAPALVTGLGKVMSKPDANGKKHNNMSFGTHFILSMAGYFAGGLALDKLSHSKRVNIIADDIIHDSKQYYTKIKNSEFITNLTSKVKTPEFIKSMTDKAKNSENFMKVADKSLNIGKKAVKHAPWLLALSMLGATLYTGVKQGNEIASTKSKIKNAQLDVARNVIEAYRQENEALKA